MNESAATQSIGREKGITRTSIIGIAANIFLVIFKAIVGLLSGSISIVLDAVKFEESLEGVDYVITGEGRLDSQTANGKVPVGVARIAKKYGAKVLAFAGGVTNDAGACNQEGIDAFFPILRRISTLQEAMDPSAARQNMIDTSEQVFRLIRTMR